MTADTGAVVVPAAGWYPDPVQAGARRWWDGASWTEHVQQPEPDPAPDLVRFSRDPVLHAVQEEYSTVPVRDPYRDRNWLGGLALVVALLSIPATVLSLLFPPPILVASIINGAPLSLAVLGLVASFKLGHPTRMAWLAIAISIVTMAVGWIAGVQELGDLPIPGLNL